MSFIADWWNHKFQKQDPDKVLALYRDVFGTAAGRQIIMYWVDEILMKPPVSHDPYEAIHWKAQCHVIRDIINALDAAEHPDKYRQEPAKPRHVVGGPIGR